MVTSNPAHPINWVANSRLLHPLFGELVIATRISAALATLVMGLYAKYPFAYSRFPIPDSRFPIPDSQFSIPDSQFYILHSTFPIPDSRFPIPDY
ncbi:MULTISPECIES: hypothetical protein [unclassified Moorena]|uniref:hypothetical protein n=2 Tax=Moorena TaxID=1155738 RepID=UPI0013BC79EF|nr:MULTISPECIES: hypothetical protein [unclassified Moorena]NEP32618.1 hypothetical protein [Moorena sp. SIO3B2]NER86388.1 hypothetical protein [Moorena sp. SIO3A2]NET66206.1 hypothetical protein [Moorena sp. SIO1G6]